MDLLYIVLLLQLFAISVEANKLDVTGIRLVDGSGLFEGRVEIQIDGVWGTVCDEDFRIHDATVMCRMMGLLATGFLSGAHFGQGTGPVFVQEFNCNGYETHIRDCTFEANVFCSHTRDVSIICSECGQVSITNGGVNSISADGTVLTISCNNGYQIDKNTSTCQNGSWSAPALTCTQIGYPLNISDIRLANGLGISDGRVEVRVNGIWGRVCGLGFGTNEGRVICNMLGFPDLYSVSTYYNYDIWYYGHGSGPVYMDYVDCRGTESHINNCSYRVVPACNYRYPGVVVFCKYPVNATDMRLEDGTGIYDGRVEISINGNWGTVCSRYGSSSYIATYAMETLCRMMSLKLTKSFRTAVYGQSSGLILTGYLHCNGPKDSINECTINPPSRRYCSHNYELSLVCTPCGPPDILHGYLYSVNGTEFIAKCNNSYIPEEYKLHCLGNGTWKMDGMCALNYTYPLKVDNVRLSNGYIPSEGRVEILVDGSWGTVCDNNFSNLSAKVICQMLGLRIQTYYTGASKFGRGTGPIYVDNLHCNGSELHINNCSYNVENTCTHAEDVSVICTGYQLNITSIRLTGTSSLYHGRVEIEVNGTWGTIGDDYFNSSDGLVVSRMLGLEYYAYRHGAAYGQGSGPIFVDRLDCGGSETHINQCRYSVDNYYNTQHYEDVSIICWGNQLNMTDIRLAGTSGPYHGRVEVEVNGTWGTIGHDYFYQSDGVVVCRMLGLEVRTYVSGAAYGQGSGPIYIDRLNCRGSETHINQCKYLVDNPYSIQHNKDVSVICWGPKLNITDARLANGTGPYDGRAEIKVNDTWGTICDENFNLQDADFFCRILGLRAAQIFTGALNGEGSGPIFIDQLFCSIYDSDLSSCKYLFLNECSHEQDISVVCNECGQPDISHWDAGYFTFNDTTLYADCTYYRTYVGTLKLTCDNETQSWVTEGECQEYSYPLNVTGIRLAGGPRPSSGRVEIKSLDRWGTVCDDNFRMVEANVICNMIGFPPAVSYYAGAHYGEGQGPIFADDLSCGEEALELNDCTYKTYDDCSHGDDISVVCTDCGDPTPEHGFINSSSTRYETAVHVTCKQDYELIGEADIICQLNGNWSSKPKCKLIDCKDPTPEHGTRNTTVTTNGTVVLIQCEEGYNMSGDSVIVCQPDGRWTDYPSCEIIDCRTPKPKNADVTLAGNATTFGETAIITCWEGHTPSDTGSSTISCLANGYWEVWSDCIPVDCYNPVPNKGSANTTDTTYGTVVKITCPPGYNISGDSIIICQADGTWTDTPVCDTSDCGILSVANGEANTTLGTTIGAIATINCNEGYTLNGSSTVVCITSGWNDSSVACEIQVCEDPTPSNGSVKSTDGSNGYVFRNYAEIECNVGFELKGESVITCEDGGVWSDLPSCELRDCGNLTAPADGNMDDTQGTKYRAHIIFSCNKGFLLVGESKTTCNEIGEWTNAAPVCVKKSDVGGTCQSEAYCLYEDSMCINSICTCFTGIYDRTAKICDIMPLLPYGTLEGDISMPKGQGCGGKVTFELGFPVFNRKHKDIYICWYGFLSLGSVYANPTPPKNKNLSGLGKRNILAPFNARINILNSGSVYYRSFDIRSSYDRLKENEWLVSYIEMIVRKFGNRKSFDASFALIVTWDGAKPLQGFDMSKTSTFQAVLTSDGKTTYAFYIYGYGKMQWVNNLSSGPQVWVGYSMDTITYTHAYSFTNPVLHLDSKLSIATSVNDVAGLVFTTLNAPGKQHENPAVDCVRWYNDNYEDKKRLDFIASMTPECPCDIWLSRFDPWFWRIGLQRWRTDITYACVDMLHVGIFGHYGKRCCYDLRSRLWVYERPYAGGFQLYNPSYRSENILNDVIPKQKCCNQSNYCNLYYELRPTGSCYKTSPYDFGIFWGDPHFRTLDGLNFTFNGLGEYVLLQVRGNKTFDLHSRTERPVKEDGNLSEATIFTAFAAKDSTNASVHVELNREKKGIVLYGNRMDLTSQYSESINSSDPFQWTSDDNNLIIAKRDETLSVLFPSFGISLNISLSVEMLSLNALVNKTLKGRTHGLLGNYNGDPNDDFTLPNGTVLNANITEREVFGYGKLWAIDANNSAFLYDKGKSHLDYHNASYVPKFLDEADPKKVAEAEKICNGSHNIQCVFDYVFTEKPAVALKTNDIKVDSDTTRSELDETLPSLIGCDMLFARKGEQVTCNFIADDNDEVYFLDNSVNATIDRESSSVVYYQENEDPVNIRIASRNTNGRSSTAIVLDVLLCTNCDNHGQCTNVSRGDDRENEYYKIASCDCEPEFDGPDCENEYDGCAANPCSLNRTCITLSAKDQKLLGRSYNCSTCPDGYTVDSQDVTECLDIDECKDDTDNCQHACRNIEGSYECSCNAGYRVDSKDPTKCKDINECDDKLDSCTQICNNSDGSFTCQCHAGYTIDTTTGACKQTGDGPCNVSQNEACSETNGCTLDNEMPVCFCSDGYALDNTGRHCIDIDECSRNLCPHDCVNRDGGFECVCYPGYRLEGRTTCTECDIPHWGENCTEECACTGRGANRCDSVKGCVCDDGWQGDTCNEDIDECDLAIQICHDSRTECVNNLGSYSCECKTGFIETEQGTCEDIDECSDPLLDKCSQICENTFGGYSCNCDTGYTKDNKTACADIDECDLELSQCEQICINDPGKYSCYCNFGYILNDDRKTCSKVSDRCFEINNLTCSHFCLDESDSAECSCRVGYSLESDNVTCKDINECENPEGNQCDAKANCTNTDGSFLCECPVGMQLENDGRTCTECDDYHFGKNCLQKCNCLYGTCDKRSGCVCSPGWGGRFCDTDIDECDTELLVCSKENTVCVNTLGSATCSCKSGFVNTSGVCKDIDECSDTHLNSCDQVCNNTEGGYICSCRPGFVMKGKCTDIDECAGSHLCDQVCENTAGSYKCSCEKGFVLNLSDRKSCRPEHECSLQESNTCPEHSTCSRNNGVVICTCMKGYQNSSSGNTCEDIDECDGETKPCSENCSNTDGSFVCSCNVGKYLMEDKVTCRECDLWNYGVDCAADCTCNKTNTDLCDPVDGQCGCKHGWSGNSCDIDIDECKEDVCPANSTCRNSIGSFSCKCNDGFFKTGDGICEACREWTYGRYCESACTCVTSNTDTCDSKTGDCICKLGWNGTNCETDIDECVSDAVCPEHSSCQNSEGSYDCRCDIGYIKHPLAKCQACEAGKYGENCTEDCLCVVENTETCHHVTGNCSCKTGWTAHDCSKDVNECDEKDSHCVMKLNSECFNTNGSFNCVCNEGYRDDEHICTECTGNTYGKNCKGQCDCHMKHSENEDQTCNTVTGQCECKQNWKGQTCMEDVNECENDVTLCADEGNKTCVNTDGWYKCDCIRGFKETLDENCVEDIGQTTQTPVGDIMIDVTVTLDYNLPAGTNLNASSTYDDLKSKCEASLLGFVSQFVSRSIQIIVNDIRLGSLIVDYTIVYGTKDATVGSQLTEAVLDLQRGSYLSFDGHNVSASSDTYKNLDPCGVYQDTIGSCEDGFNCTVENNVPICKLIDGENDVNWPMIIGLSAAGIFLLIATAVMVVLIRRFVRRPKKSPHLTQRIYHDHSFNRGYDEMSDFYKMRGKAECDEVLYPTWKSKLTSSTMSSQENLNAFHKPYFIPRARISLPSKEREDKIHS